MFYHNSLGKGGRARHPAPHHPARQPPPAVFFNAEDCVLSRSVARPRAWKCALEATLDDPERGVFCA
jgi:hypothetical protein